MGQCAELLKIMFRGNIILNTASQTTRPERNDPELRVPNYASRTKRP